MATQTVTSQNFEHTINDNDLVFVDFWATWCRPCKAFEPIFEKASESNTDITFGKVDIDANQELAAAADIQAVPTLMVTKKGQIIFKQAGALRASDLDDLIAQAKKADVSAPEK
ncbi:thioredoxin [Bifidobacterium aquikefiricola]|uniref:Thioredoxin n=1 Tax=Bifidobacterium aquikefiricola TaxID=3059038 RepID=A0AB39U7V4_9BIFI